MILVADDDVVVAELSAGMTRFWQRLVEPSPRVLDVGDRQSARLLASLLLIVIAVGLLSAVGQLFWRPDFAATFAIILTALLTLGAAYGVSRTARFRVAGITAACVPILAGAVVGWSVPDDPAWFGFMALGPLIASAFLPTRWVAILAAATVAGVAAVLGVGGRGLADGHGIAVLSFSLAVSILVAVVAVHRAGVETARRQDALERQAHHAQVLLLQQQRFEALLEHSADLTVLLGQDGTLHYVNPAFAAMLGYALDDWRQRSVMDLVHPDDLALARDAFERSLAQPRRVISAHLRLRHANGSYRLLEGVGANHLDDPATRGLVINARDVTERRRAEETTRENLQRLRVAMEVADLQVFEHDADLRYTWVHSPGRGEAPAEVIGRTDLELFGDDGRSIMAIKRRVLDTGQRERQDVRVRVDGRDVWYDLTVEPIRSADGAMIGLRGAALDVSQTRSLQAQLQHAQKMETLGRLAGGVAHDFNNLLTIIGGAASMAVAGLLSADPRRHDLETIEQTVRRAALLTHQLLAFSRRQVLQLTVIDLDDVVGSVALMLRRLLGTGIELVTSHTEGLHAVCADAGQIEQVIVNLAVNARDAMPDGGTLTIRTANEDLDDSRAAHLDVGPGPYVCLTVQDSGVGMDQATQDRIFEPFFTTKPMDRGTGLGLPTVYGIVRQSRGAVEVSSTLGSGSTFRVYLPRTDKLPDAPVVSRSPAPARGTGTILVVEDEPTIRDLARRQLAGEGYTVFAAGDAAEAMRFADAHEETVDLVVADVLMPGMHGPELVRQLRFRYPDLSALYISGYTDESAHWLEDGADFIAKPFQMPELVQRVHAMLHDRRSG